jgi:DNA-binding PadR family transcriptional regulator
MSKTTSELEGAVLGVIWREGPCTAYTVRKRFVASPSPQWSGSAGAIYPLVRRLEKKRLLASRILTGTKRGGRLFTLTSAGQQMLNEWIKPPLSPMVTGVPADPLRTRIGFLGALIPAERRIFIEAALQGNDAEIQTTLLEIKDSREENDHWHLLAAQGALACLRARRIWLQAAARSLPRKRRSAASE